MKDILKDIFRNFWFPLLLGFAGFIIFTTYITEIDMVWYYIGITICSGGGVACIIYGIKKYFKL